MEIKADLHTHTTASDGAFDAATLVGKLHDANISIFSVTDHDTVGSIPAAMGAARELQMECIPGIEMNTWLDESDVHILGYFFDYTAPAMMEYTARCKRERLKRAEKMIEKLNALHIPLTMEEVLRQSNGAVVGRPHIAAALLAGKYTSVFAEAFYKYIGNSGPAYEPLRHFSFPEALTLMHSLGGIAVIAHPAIISEETLLQAINAGADGIEVTHPSSSTSQSNMYRSIASEYFLIETGGSDFHGGARNDLPNLGKYWIPGERVEKIRNFARLHSPGS